MKTRTATSLVVIVALALLACLVVLRSRPEEPGEPVASSVSVTAREPSFEVRVEKPRSARPLFGVLPTKLEEKLSGSGEPRFDHTSRGAEVGGVGRDRLELRADGWRLLIEIDGAGRIAPGTRLVFPMLLAGKQRTLRCRPADASVGNFRVASRASPDVLDGRFLVELATCENAETGKTIEYPPAPLVVRGSFAGLPQDSR